MNSFAIGVDLTNGSCGAAGKSVLLYSGVGVTSGAVVSSIEGALSIFKVDFAAIGDWDLARPPMISCALAE